MNNEEFYHRCAEILGQEYACQSFQHYKRTRWNNRKPGSGRFPDHGVVRVFGENLIQMLLPRYGIHCTAKSKAEALSILERAVS